MSTRSPTCNLFRRVGIAILIAASLSSDVLAAKRRPKRAARAEADAWSVTNATVRFRVTIRSRPSIPSAGIVALLPDGGILPTPVPRPVVVEKAEGTLPSQVLWHNPDEGLAVLFAAPEDAATKAVHIYLAGSSRSEASRSIKGVKPSILYYWALEDEDKDISLTQARRLARRLPPLDEGVCMGVLPRIGQRFNPFGPDEYYTAYYRGYLNIAQPGRYYLATVSDDGSEFAIDGDTVVSWPGEHARIDGGEHGEHGKWLDLRAGTHLVEYFFFEKTGWQEAHLLWRTPEHSQDAVPITVPDSAYVHSGEAHAVLGRQRNGAPVASIKSVPLGYVWLEGKPLNLFRLEAQYLGPQKKDCGYEWQIGHCGPIKQTTLDWLFVGNAPTDVTLRVTWNDKRSTCRIPVYWERTPKQLSLNTDEDRALLKQTLISMHMMTDRSEHNRLWQPEFLGLFAELVDPFADTEILADLLKSGRKCLQKAQPNLRWSLENMLYEGVRLRDRKAAIRCLYAFRKDAASPARIVQLAFYETERLLYDERAPEKAGDVLTAVESKLPACAEDVRTRFLVRRGDVARMSGDTDTAAAFYGEAQQRYHATQRGRSGVEWRGSTVRGVAYYDQFRNLLENASPQEALDLLRAWEIEFPMQKLTGILPIAEAEYCVKVRDLQRAATLLEAYRSVTEVSNYLVTAFEMELACLDELDREEERRATARDIVRRYPTHRIAETARQILGQKEGRP